MSSEASRYARELRAKKVLIVGFPGSGKTTLARAMADDCGLPHLEVDRFYWAAEKGGETRADFRAALEKSLSADSWIVEGHYAKIRSFLPKPDCIVVLMPSLGTLCARLIRRDLVEILKGKQKTSDLVFVLKNRGRLARQLAAIPTDWLDTPALVL